VADASIPVDAEADAEDREDFRRFLERTSPAELVRHLSKAHPEPALDTGELAEEAEPSDESGEASDAAERTDPDEPSPPRA